MRQLVTTTYYERAVQAGRPGSSEVPRNPLTRWDVSSTPANGIFLTVLCVFFPFILDIKFVGRTSRGHTGGRSQRISYPPSFCGCCCCCYFLTLTDPLRIQPWSQDRRNQTKSNREIGGKLGNQTEENGEESSQQRTSSRQNRKHKEKHTDSRNNLEATV